jgi:hypothetical protein
MGEKIHGDIPGMVQAFHTELASAASNATAQVGYFVAPCDIRLKQAALTFLAAFTGQATDHPSWNVTNLGQAGTGAVKMAERVFATTAHAVAAKCSIDLTLSDTAANRLASKGDIIVVNRAVVGDGKVSDKIWPTLIWEFQ